MALKATWLGSASFVLEDAAGHVVFIDPWLDGDKGNPGCPMKVSDVSRADLVLVTHGDRAHYGRGDSVKVAAKTGCLYATNVPLAEYVVSKGLLPKSQVVPLDLNERYSLLGILEVTVFPVIHPPAELRGPVEIPREPNTGFALTMAGVPILYTGDTIPGDEVYRGVAAQYPPLAALVPVASPFEEASHGSPEETVETAAAIVRMTGAKIAVPHYRWAPNNVAVGMLAEALASEGVEVLRLNPGQSFTL